MPAVPVRKAVEGPDLHGGDPFGKQLLGQVPRGVLCAVGDTMLRCDVAKRAKRLAADYAREFRGERLDFITGYRDIVGQIQRGPEGTLVDIPGTEVIVDKMPVAPEGYEIARIDVVVRLKKAARRR